MSQNVSTQLGSLIDTLIGLHKVQQHKYFLTVFNKKNIFMFPSSLIKNASQMFSTASSYTSFTWLESTTFDIYNTMV